MQSVADTKLSWPDFLAELSRPSALPAMNWPNFFVVGPHKTGSSSLYMHLKRHPQIFLPDVKHANPFQPESIHRMRIGGVDQCRAWYANAKGYKAIGEVNPDYFPDPAVPARIREVCPNARIIIVLRDPVERAYSHYLTTRYTNPAGTAAEPAKSFREALLRYEKRSAKKWHLSQEYIEHSLYHASVRRYLQTFGTEQVLLLLFDDLKKNPADILARIARHIGVDPVFFAKVDVSEDGNPFRTPKNAAVRWGRELGIQKLLPDSFKLALRPIFLNMKKPPLDAESRRQLQEVYDPDVTRLEELLGRKLPELRKSWI